MNPHLLFEFADATGIIQPKEFTNPIEVLVTNSIDEVTEIFTKVERAVEQGLYVAGYVSYEAAPAFDVNYKVHRDPTLPLVWFGIFLKPIEKAIHNDKKFKVSNWSSTSDQHAYQSGIQKIKDAIENGNTYQVNYTTRLQASFTGDDKSFYHQLVRNQQASYCAYLNLGRFRILSASPELFFHIKDNKIRTKPMKGTIQRGRTTIEDQTLINQLRNSEKEQAENLMIVDLLRNDIGRIAKAGTVKVPKLFEVESYPTVHQMTSTITAELEDETSILDWFRALFPCGSITGAPKISTMAYIAELEKSPRNVYCGAIGYITPEREAVFNVPIRTVIIDSENQLATYGAGGGITWDSTVKGEYGELLTKAKLLTEHRKEFQLLESIKLEDGEFPLLSYHLKRLENSAIYFQFHLDSSVVKDHLSSYATEHSEGTYKLRLLVNRDGQINLNGQPITTIKKQIDCVLATTAIDNQNPFLYHKTTERTHYAQLEDSNSTIFTTLLYNKSNELTEFTIGNVVIRKGDNYYTPPVSCGLLAGTYRQYLLDKGILQEKIIKIDELSQMDELIFINSVRGWVPVNLMEREEL